MTEDFKDCMVGAIIVALLLVALLVLVTLFSAEQQWEIVVLTPVAYLAGSALLYGYLAFSRNQLVANPTMFVAATIFMTAGGWWLGHALAWLNVKLTEGVYRLVTSIF